MTDHAQQEPFAPEGGRHPPTRLAYSLSLDDLLAFHEYHSEHSAFIKRLSRKTLIVSVLAYLVAGGVFGLMFWSYVGLLAGVPLAAYAAITGPRRFRKAHRKAALRIYQESSHPGTIGVHRIEITESGIAETNSTGGQTTTWEGVERIESTPTHGFVYTGGDQAHVIPIASLFEGDFETFMAELRRRRKTKLKLPPSPPGQQTA